MTPALPPPAGALRLRSVQASATRRPRAPGGIGRRGGASLACCAALTLLLASGAACTPSGSDASPSRPAEPALDVPGVAEYRLVPALANVQTGATLQLEVQQCGLPEAVVSEEGVVVPPLHRPISDEGTALPLDSDCVPLEDASILHAWSVNGTAGGSPVAGTVTPAGSAATYTSPQEVPDGNPVAVSVGIRLPGPQKVLLVSNVTVGDDCPVPVCRYEGTSWQEDVLEEPGNQLRIRGDARVVWTFSHMDGRSALYTADGHVTARWTHDHCTIVLSPSEHTFAGGRGARLTVDFTTDPVTYRGSGSSEWPARQTWCTNDDPWTDENGGGSAGWFSGEGVAKGGGSVLSGSAQSPHRRSVWEFRAVR